MKQFIIVLIIILTGSSGLQAKHGFAIVIDKQSYGEAEKEIQDYAAAIEEIQGLQVYTVVDRWGIPDSIRACLKEMYASPDNPLAGAVFIGDIPVPMIRDAQHLTSAFKMDQKQDRKESSVPSDRFYDDFGLEFNYIGKENDAPYFYYSLKGNSTQVLRPDLFTGRIRPTDNDSISRYEKLRRYLRKATAAKRSPEKMEEMMYFTGNGSLSESKVAAIDEKAAYYEHFPWLQKNSSSISYMDFSQERYIKESLMNELMRPDLDFAMLHHHGDWDTQYLSSTPRPSTVKEATEYIKKRLRNEIRSPRNKTNNPDSLITAYAEKYGIPEKWLDGTFDTETIAADSISETLLDLHLSDFSKYGFKPNCRYVMFDACYNGSFHRDDCIANEYIFSEGKTVAVIGGSVNVLQDKWYDKYCGLLGLGVFAGYINMYQQYLESHLIGDPTFTFAPAVKCIDINELIADNRSNTDKKHIKRVEKLLESDIPDLQSLALELLDDNARITSAQLLQTLSGSKYSTVRLQALQLLARHRGDDFIQGVIMAASDRYEMLQRFAVNYIRQSGDKRLVPSLVRLYIDNNASARIKFNAGQTIMFFTKEDLTTEFEKQFRNKIYIRQDSVRMLFQKDIDRSAGRWGKEIDELYSDKLTESNFNFIAGCMRLYCPHYRVPDLIRYIRTSGNSERQIKLIEALGWMRLSYNADLISTMAKEMSENVSLPEAVREEALKTYNRVK